MVETLVWGLVAILLLANDAFTWWKLIRLRDRVGKLVIDRSDLILRLDIVGREQNELIQRMDLVGTLNDVSALVDDINHIKERLLALERNAPEKGPTAVRGVVAARRMVADLGGAKDIQ